MRKTDKQFIRWYHDFFYFRKSLVNLKGINKVVYHTQGAPQGACGSPLLWNLVLNELIKLVKDMPTVRIVCYADDLAIFAWGPDVNDCAQRAQAAVNAIMAWAAEHLLTLSPTKSEAKIFTRKKKYWNLINNVTPITVSGASVHWEFGAVRYLGIWLDHGLRWNEHVKIKTDKVRGLMHKISGATGENWGLRPYLGKYFWETMGRTVLSYGCLGWYPAIQRKTVRQKLQRVQRMGFKRMCHFRRGTPNRGLELLFGVPPIEVFVTKTALKAYFRTEGLAPHTKETMKTNIPSHKGHRQVLQEIIEGNATEHLCEPIEPLEHLLGPMDHITPKRLWVREFKVDTESMITGREGYGVPRFAEPGILTWTDGSKRKNNIGVGIALTKNNKFMKGNGGDDLIFGFKLRDQNSVYQSEMWAILKAAKMIMEKIEEEDIQQGQEYWIKKGEPLTIYSDSQATLKALNAVEVKSRLTMDTIDALNQLTRKLDTQVILRWVKAHKGYDGNEATDKAAAEAGALDAEAIEADSPNPPKALLHTEVDAACTQMWRNIWENTLGHRQTRYWFPNGPDPKFVFDIIRLPKPICSQVVAFITGHCHLNRHQALIDDANTELIRKHIGNTGDDGEDIIPPADRSCTMCKHDPSQSDKEETPLHLMSECIGLYRLRLNIFGKEDPQPPFQFPVYKIVAFLKQANIPSFPMQPFLEEQFPAAPTGIQDPDPNPPPHHPQHTRSPSTEGTDSPTSAHTQTPTSSRRDDQNHNPSTNPDGDRWHHTYLYISNPLPKPHKEKEMLKNIRSRPLRY